MPTNKVLSHIRDIIEPQLLVAQSGLCVGQSTDEQAMAPHCMLDTYRAWRRMANIIFTDLNKAFDPIGRRAIPTVLLKYRISQLLVAILMQLYIWNSEGEAKEYRNTSKNFNNIWCSSRWCVDIFLLTFFFLTHSHTTLLCFLQNASKQHCKFHHYILKKSTLSRCCFWLASSITKMWCMTSRESFGCWQCRWVIRLQGGNFCLDYYSIVWIGAPGYAIYIEITRYTIDQAKNVFNALK